MRSAHVIRTPYLHYETFAAYGKMETSVTAAKTATIESARAVIRPLSPILSQPEQHSARAPATGSPEPISPKHSLNADKGSVEKAASAHRGSSGPALAPQHGSTTTSRRRKSADSHLEASLGGLQDTVIGAVGEDVEKGYRAEQDLESRFGGPQDLETALPLPSSQRTSLAFDIDNRPALTHSNAGRPTPSNEDVPRASFHSRRSEDQDTASGAGGLEKDTMSIPRPPKKNLNDHLIQGYLGRLQPRRTLDQYLFSQLESTTHRDNDQVVYRYTQTAADMTPKIFMVDQLWLWVLGDGMLGYESFLLATLQIDQVFRHRNQ